MKIANTQPSALPLDKPTRKLWSKLTDKLLRIGGKRVVWQGAEPHLAELVSHGQVFDEPVKRRKMTPNRCHENAATLWARDVKHRRIVTGYALSVDGLWRQHSWVLKKKALYETTVSRDKYFGIVLDEEESAKFWMANAFDIEHFTAEHCRQLDKRLVSLLEKIAKAGEASKLQCKKQRVAA